MKIEWEAYGYRANKIWVSHQDVGEEHSHDNRPTPCSDETLDGLLRAQLDKLGTSKKHTADVGKNIVGNNKRSGKEEPDHALKDVVDNEMGFNNDDVQGHVRPGELGKLELVVAFLERTNKKDETCGTNKLLLHLWDVGCSNK